MGEPEPFSELIPLGCRSRSCTYFIPVYEAGQILNLLPALAEGSGRSYSVC